MKQKGFPTVLVLFMALVVFGGYLIYQNQNKSIPSQQAKQSSPTPIDEIANWETYTNTEYRFSFKYPKGWNVNSENNTVKISNRNSSMRFQTSPYPSINFDKLYEKPDGTIDQNPVFIRTKIKNLEIGGYKATMYTNESSAANQNKSFDISVYIVQGAPITMISGQTNPDSKENLLSIFNQVISTFKFTQ